MSLDCFLISHSLKKIETRSINKFLTAVTHSMNNNKGKKKEEDEDYQNLVLLLVFLSKVNF